MEPYKLQTAYNVPFKLFMQQNGLCLMYQFSLDQI